VALIPPAVVVSYAVLYPQAPEQILEVNVELTVMPYQMPSSESKDVRLLSAVKVTNTSDQTYRNMNISLNKQFFYYHPHAVPKGAAVEVPLEFFVTKGGSIKFQTGNKKVNQVTVFAQIESNARAVAERYFDDAGNPKSSKN
jgi:hypothetical protein